MTPKSSNSLNLDGLWRGLKRNWGLKLAALLVACALWLYSTATAERTRVFNVPVNLVNVPPGTVVTAGNERSVPVQIRGSGMELLAVSDEDFSAEIDLQGHRPGTFIHRLTTSDITTPPDYGFKVVSLVSQDQLRIALDAEKVSLVKVRPRIIGHPPEGTLLADAASQPAWVRLRGPASALEGIDYIETAPVSVAGVTESSSVQVALMPTSPGIELVDGRLVVVNLELVPEQVVDRSLPLEVEGLPAGLSAELEPDSVEAVLSLAAEAELDEPLRAVVVPPLWLSGEYEVPVRLLLPPEVYIKSLNPPRVTLRLNGTD
jgi:YbbR domain-containing protein